MLTVVDWTTLVFFISMFIVIGAVQEVGLISLVAGLIQQAVRGNLIASIFVIVWVSALMSGVVANIPFTAAMLPVVDFLTRTTAGAEGKVLFYSLSVSAEYLINWRVSQSGDRRDRRAGRLPDHLQALLFNRLPGHVDHRRTKHALGVDSLLGMATPSRHDTIIFDYH